LSSAEFSWVELCRYSL